jgi:MFS family permease
MIIPELPAYLTLLGGADYKGLIIALFTVTAAFSRPYSGKIVDKIGRTPIMFFGITVCTICCLLYPLVSSVFGFFIIRLLHGFSVSAATASSAMLADLVPANRRGEALGVLGLISNVGTAFSPVIGSEIAKIYTIETLFYTASSVGFCGFLMLLGLKETLQEKQMLTWQDAKLRKKELFEPSVFNPALVMFLMVFAFGAVLVIMPDISESLGISNKGYPLMFYTIASLSVRIFAGKVSDKYGRISVMRVALALQAISLTLMGFAPTPFLFFASTTLYGFSMGLGSPTLLAWTVDLSNATNRGRALATVYLTMEAGIGLGAFSAGFIYNNNPAMFAYTFWAASFMSLLGFLYVVFLHKSRELATTIRK